LVYSVAFSPDGNRVFGWDRWGHIRAWTVSDGQPTEPVNPPQLFPDQRLLVSSPDGSLHAEIRNSLIGSLIVLIDTEAERRDREEREALEPVNRLWWHQQQAFQSEQDKEWFAAAFHLDQLLKDKPNDPDLIRRRDQALEKSKPPEPMLPLPRP
jgi:hypothetical protein